MQQAFQPQIILLREGTDTSQGKSQIISNINACQAVAETLRTTLGPRGMDKLVFDGQKTTISNDGATIMRLLDIVHPAAKCLVDISMAQVIIMFFPLACYSSLFSRIYEMYLFKIGCRSWRWHHFRRASGSRDSKRNERFRRRWSSPPNYY
jgi:hypothetical protein